MTYVWPTSPYRRQVIEIDAERDRQDERFGEQNHPDGTGAEHHPVLAEWWQQHNAKAVASGTLTWLGVLAEEFHEALAETDPVRIRAELVQVAAVAAAWVEAIDRRGATEPVSESLERRAA